MAQRKRTRKNHAKKLNRRQQAGWEQRSEQERQDGLSAADPAARWLADSTHYLGPERDWRSKPVTPAQERELRRRDLNPFAYRTRGAAADALDGTRRRP